MSTGTIDVHTLPSGVGSTSPSGEFNVSLTCDENVAVNAAMTDQDPHRQISQSVVTLTGDSIGPALACSFFITVPGR